VLPASLPAAVPAPVTSAELPVPGAAPAPCATPGCQADRPGGGEEPSWWDEQKAGWARFKACLRACFIGYPEEFVPRPLGASVYDFGNTMVANGDAGRMVFYHYDFVDGSDQLNLRGKDHAGQVACLLHANLWPVLVERTPCTPGLDESRRLAVLNELAHCGVVLPDDRVVVGKPAAPGLRGIEAEIIFRNLLQQTLSGGTARPGSGGAVGVAVGQGFSPGAGPTGPGGP
jgi:hypothetical protein